MPTCAKLFRLTDQIHTLKASDFGPDFLWGVATAAAQIEGASNQYGKGQSIWDSYSRRQGKIKSDHKPTIACDFYHRYKDDLLLVKALGFSVFRFSISWPRILPEGTGKPNREGLAFYHKVIDECLQLGLIPMVTLYHWDLPLELEKQGGWTSHMINRWFNRFVTLCAEEYGDKVKQWIVLNEPMGFTSLGYMLGKHAPGRTGLSNFLPAIHHAAIAQADGGRILRSSVKNAHIGTSYSCSEIVPYSDTPADIQAAHRMDVLLNRLYIEPALGKGFPDEDMPILEKLRMHNTTWKYTDRYQFDFDFIGLQNYFPVVIRHNSFIPFIHASEVKPAARKVPQTAMKWEINPNAFYNILKRFWKYGAIKEIIVTENGAAFNDQMKGGTVNDAERIAYYQQYIHAMWRAKKEGVNIRGYLAWTLMDNFEWAEGYHARFGLVHVDFKTQLRTIKNSGYWFRSFLEK